MRIAVTGSSGLIGRALVERLRTDGHEVIRVVRSDSPDGERAVRWDPAAGRIDSAGLAGIEGMVHLAGEGIGDHRWNDEHKRHVLESRTRGTALICEAMIGLDSKPMVLVSGSAIGYYGDRGDEELTEASPPGDTFLADVCKRWEAAASMAAAAGIRVARIRTGVVLSKRGGALAKTLPLFRLGVGGRFGSGNQWWSWITLDDEISAICHLLAHDIEGPVNLTAPNPVTNREFTKTLGRVLHRPTFLPVPKFGPALLIGSEGASAVLYDSQRVVPAVLTEAGFRFQHPELEGALHANLA